MTGTTYTDSAPPPAYLPFPYDVIGGNTNSLSLDNQNEDASVRIACDASESQGGKFSVTFSQIDPVNQLFHGTIQGTGTCVDESAMGASGIVTVQF